MRQDYEVSEDVVAAPRSGGGNSAKTPCVPIIPSCLRMKVYS